VEPIRNDSDPDRRHSEAEQAAYIQGLRDGRIDALEHYAAQLSDRLTRHVDKTDERFNAMDRRQGVAEKLLYILAAIVALSESSAIFSIVSSLS